MSKPSKLSLKNLDEQSKRLDVDWKTSRKDGKGTVIIPPDPGPVYTDIAPEYLSEKELLERGAHLHI